MTNSTPSALEANDRGGPLKGVKILDFTIYQNGPSATAMFCDNGAVVIKVEPPEGEGVRFLGSPIRQNFGLEAFNRGKKAITLDLKHPQAKGVVRKLVEWADVLAEVSFS